MRDWITTLAAQNATGDPAVLVTVVAAKGSVPRRPGTRMIVTADTLHGTIGGGHLEYKAIDIARGVIANRGASALHRFPLGASLGQCCGGLAQLLFEPVRGSIRWIDTLVELRAKAIACALVTPVSGDAADGPLLVTAETSFGTLGSESCDREAIVLARAALGENTEPRLFMLGGDARAQCLIDVLRPCDFHVMLFGAGHVGRAVVRTLAGIRCRIAWIDTRDAQFPADVPDHVECVATDTPEAEVAAAPAGAYFLVMTHSHAQDEAIAERILARNDFAYFGLIGSLAKRRQFERRIEARGMPRARFAAMTCPIGVAGIAGKEPEVIAIAVAAELLQVRSKIATTQFGYAAHCA